MCLKLLFPAIAGKNDFGNLREFYDGLVVFQKDCGGGIEIFAICLLRQLKHKRNQLVKKHDNLSHDVYLIRALGLNRYKSITD